jgi:hypothetical protein
MKIRDLILESMLDEDLDPRFQEKLLKSLNTYYQPYRIEIYFTPHAFSRIDTRTFQTSENMANAIEYMIANIIGTNKEQILKFRKDMQDQTFDIYPNDIIEKLMDPSPSFNVTERSYQRYKLAFSMRYDRPRDFINHEFPADGFMKVIIRTFFSTTTGTTADVDIPGSIALPNDINLSSVEDANQYDEWKKTAGLDTNRIPLINDILKRSILNVLENDNTLRVGVQKDEDKRDSLSRDLINTETAAARGARWATSQQIRAIERQLDILDIRITKLKAQEEIAKDAKNKLRTFLLNPPGNLNDLSFTEQQIDNLFNKEDWSYGESYIDQNLPENLTNLESKRQSALENINTLRSNNQDFSKEYNEYRKIIYKMNKFVNPIKELASAASGRMIAQLRMEFSQIERQHAAGVSRDLARIRRLQAADNPPQAASPAANPQQAAQPAANPPQTASPAANPQQAAQPAANPPQAAQPAQQQTTDNEKLTALQALEKLGLNDPEFKKAAQEDYQQAQKEYDEIKPFKETHHGKAPYAAAKKRLEDAQTLYSYFTQAYPGISESLNESKMNEFRVLLGNLNRILHLSGL